MSYYKIHPFSIDIRRDKFSADQFLWSIKSCGSKIEGCPASYRTFEEARISAQTRLERIVADWCKSNALI